MADNSKEKMGCFESHVKGRWRKSPIGHAFNVLVALRATPSTSSSLAATCQHPDAGVEGPGTEASFSASPSIQHECGGDQIAWHTTSSACCHAKSETESGSDDNDAQFGCQGCAEDLESEQPHKRERERHVYMSGEQMFASFSSKRKYEREWRHKKKKKKKKGGKKHNKKSMEQKGACFAVFLSHAISCLCFFDR